MNNLLLELHTIRSTNTTSNQWHCRV